MQDPEVGFDIEDVAKMIEYSGGLDPGQFLFDMATAVDAGLVKTRKDLPKIATYLTAIGQLNDEVWIYAHEHIWPGVASDPAFQA